MPATAVQTRNFTDPAGYGARLLGFAQFDPALGALGGIRLGLTASVSGSLAVESLEAASFTVGYTSAAFLSVFAPDSTPLAQLVAPAYGAATLVAYDGTVDFAGPSGITLAVTGSASSSTTLPAGGSIANAPFIGTGTVSLPVGDYALNSIAGPANMRVLASAAAAGTATLAYDYTPGLPGGSYQVSLIRTCLPTRAVRWT